MAYEKKERYITVTDDWFPCYEGNKVRLSLSLNQWRDEYYVKIAAWGNDDYGLEIVYDGYSNLDDAREKYDTLIPIFNNIPDGIDKDWFINKGFKRF